MTAAHPVRRRTLVWFRNDLRTDDNPALSAATCERGVAIAVHLCAGAVSAARRRRQSARVHTAIVDVAVARTEDTESVTDPNRPALQCALPELAALQATALFEPWRFGGVKGYPAPIVEHGAARQRALKAFTT